MIKDGLLNLEKWKSLQYRELFTCKCKYKLVGFEYIKYFTLNQPNQICGIRNLEYRDTQALLPAV